MTQPGEDPTEADEPERVEAVLVPALERTRRAPQAQNSVKPSDLMAKRILNDPAQRRKLWRALPHSFAYEISDHQWQPAPHLVLISRLLHLVSLKAITRLGISMPPGSGKPLAVDTPVWTLNRGWQAHGDLRTGDVVWDASGSPTVVLARTDPFEAKAQVVSWPTEEITCGRAHHFPVLISPTSRALLSPTTQAPTTWLKSAKLIEAQHLTPRYHISPLTALTNNAGADTEEDLERAWLCGFWWARGTRWGQLHTTKTEDTPTVLKHLERAGFSPPLVDEHRDGHLLTSIGFLRHLEDDGAIPTPGEHRRDLPPWWLKNSLPWRKAVWSGIADGAGTRHGVTAAVGTQLEIFLAGPHRARHQADLAHLLRSIGSNPKQIAQSALTRVSVCDNPWTLPRKQNWHKQPHTRNHTANAIQASERTGERELNCIQTQAGTYLAGRTLQPTANSELVSKYHMAWRFEHDPALKAIFASYESTYAEEWGQALRELISHEGADDGKQRLNVHISPESRAAGKWRTTRKGTYYAVGAGGALTGRRAMLSTIDDPHKDWSSAVSTVLKDRVWNWFTSVVRTRSMPGAQFVVIHTRWALDDLIGRLTDTDESLVSRQWDFLTLPAIAEQNETIETVLGERTVSRLRKAGIPVPTWFREEGAALWPTLTMADGTTADWFNEAEYEQTKLEVGPVIWNSLYQQSPVPMTGMLFSSEGWALYVCPEEAVEGYVSLPEPKSMLLCRAWDLAASDGRGDYTVGALLAYEPLLDQIFVLDVVRDRLGAAGVDALMQVTADSDANLYGRGKVLQRIEQEPGSGGKRQAEHLTGSVMAQHWTLAEPTTGSKVANAEPWASFQAQGKAHLPARTGPKGPGHHSPFGRSWCAALVEEHRVFPTGGAHDDIVDACAHAFNDLEARGRAARRSPVEIVTSAQKKLAGAPQMGIRRPAQSPGLILPGRH